MGNNFIKNSNKTIVLEYLNIIKYTIQSCVTVYNQSGNYKGYVIVPQSGKKQTTNQYILSKDFDFM